MLDDATLCNPPAEPTTKFMRLIWPLIMCAARGGGDGRKGVFVELGAFDGITSSNTLHLEKCHGWRGVLIEGNPTNYHLLARSGRNESRLVHSAVSSRCHGGLSNFTIQRGEVSGIAEELAVRLQKYRSHFNQAKPYVFVQVPCKHLSTILDESRPYLSPPGAPRSIDFLSLDTEGTEDVVLESLLGSTSASGGAGSDDTVSAGADAADTSAESAVTGTGAWFPKVVLVECVGPVAKDEHIDKMLTAANYTRRVALEDHHGGNVSNARNRVYTRLGRHEEMRCSKLLARSGQEPSLA